MNSIENRNLFMNQRKIQVNNVEINYLKVGVGPHILLCLHGVIGAIDDFEFPVINLDKKKYTMIVWEAPGCGKSRPPDRDVSPGLFHRDADYAIALMEALRYDKYSVLGWCGGGITALIIASKVVEQVEKLVVWSCNAFITDKDMELLEGLRDIRSWNKYHRRSAIKNYGEKYVTEKWNAWIDSNRLIVNERNGNICREVLSNIVAPTLIMHGARDSLVPVEHSVYLHEHVKGSILDIFPDNYHFIYGKRFYSTVDKFLNTKQCCE